MTLECRIFANFPQKISTLSMKRSAHTKAPSVAPKGQRKMLAIAQIVRLLGMLKEGKNYAAVWRHYGINDSSARYIKGKSTKF